MQSNEMNMIRRVLLLFCIVATAFSLPADASRPYSPKSKKVKAAMKSAMNTITVDAARAHIGFLASDCMMGRKAGENSSRIAAAYIESMLRQYGIRPLNAEYRQPFDLTLKFTWKEDSVNLDMANVLGMIPGRKSDEYVVIGAHFDHLGIGTPVDGDSIYNGADDNASGVSAVLQIARAFAESGIQPERNVIFAFWDGEELGLHGSKHFVRTCPFLDKIKGYLNFDMIGRNNKPENPQHVVYFFTEAHPAFGEWLKHDIAEYGLRLDPDYRPWDKPVGGSDNASFAKKDIPIIWYHTDGHPDYHKPGDEALRINYDKVMNITRAAFLNLWNLANVENY